MLYMGIVLLYTGNFVNRIGCTWEHFQIEYPSSRYVFFLVLHKTLGKIIRYKNVFGLNTWSQV